MEAQDLEGKDTFLGGLIKGKSDPYGILQISNQMFQSKTIKETLNPKWNEVYEVTTLQFQYYLEENMFIVLLCLFKQVLTCNHCVYQALVYEHSGQHLEIELFDEDPDKDDFLGR